MRVEKDSLGTLEIPAGAYYGIHSLRSKNNFPASGEKINPVLIKAYLFVKQAAAETNFNCGHLNREKYELIDEAIDKLLSEVEALIVNNCSAIYDKVIVDPYQGGAGTSLNMNLNEIIANTAIKLAGKACGDYEFIHPLDDVNMSQSTNDTFVTALKIASVILLRELAESCSVLQRSLQKKEEEFKGILKLGRTQFQDAVPVSLGQEFGAFAQAVARDRWRIYNAEERLRSVNLGGTAVGNSIGAPRAYVLKVNAALKKITGLPVAKGEDLIDTTQNMDVFAEVHGIINAGAVSLIKICNDLRFLSSGPVGGIGEIKLPPRQTGSSIMPGKINPVILENTIQIAEMVKGHNSMIANLASAGNLELNAFAPMMAHLFLKSLGLLRDANYNFAEKCIDGIKADEEKCRQNLLNTTAIAAALIPELGYEKVQEIIKVSENENISFFKALKKTGIIDEKELNSILSKEIGINFE